MMFRRLIKAHRYWSWRFRPPESLPLFWHVGRPNFGDDVNPSFFERLTGQPVRFAADMSRWNIVGMGSVLRYATPQSIVVGAGYLRPNAGPLPPGAIVVSLRGEHSLKLADYRGELLFGDPMSLVDQLLDEPVETRYELGLVPHVLNVARMTATFGAFAKIINPAREPWRVVRDIAACARIASQSLHGLIVADALGIPNVWLSPCAGMTGGDFKFEDYFTTLHDAKPRIEPSEALFRRPAKHPFAVSEFRYSKPDYIEAIRATFRDFSRSARAA